MAILTLLAPFVVARPSIFLFVAIFRTKYWNEWREGVCVAQSYSRLLVGAFFAFLLSVCCLRLWLPLTTTRLGKQAKPGKLFGWLVGWLADDKKSQCFNSSSRRRKKKFQENARL